MKRNIATAIIFLFVLVVGFFFAIPWFPVLGDRFSNWTWSWQEREPTVEEMRKYYEKLAVPNLTSEQVIARMAEQKGLSKDDTELTRMVDYYVYHANKRVIRQLVGNLQFEVQVAFPEETGSIFLRGRDTLGKSYSILKNQWGFLRAISPVLHEELFRYSTHKDKPHLVYLIMGLICSNDRPLKRPENDRDYMEGGGVYYDVDWYSQDLVDRDVLAYLRIYANYEGCPTIRDSVLARFNHYPGDWLDSAIMRDVLSLADEQGVQPAYSLYLTGRKSKLNRK
jgi:hypothetical protein